MSIMKIHLLDSISQNVEAIGNYKVCHKKKILIGKNVSNLFIKMNLSLRHTLIHTRYTVTEWNKLSLCYIL